MSITMKMLYLLYREGEKYAKHWKRNEKIALIIIAKILPNEEPLENPTSTAKYHQNIDTQIWKSS